MEVTIDQQGGIFIPTQLLDSLGFSEGDELIVREEDDRLVLEKVEAIHIPGDLSTTKESIAERRESTGKETDSSAEF